MTHDFSAEVKIVGSWSRKMVAQKQHIKLYNFATFAFAIAFFIIVSPVSPVVFLWTLQG